PPAARLAVGDPVPGADGSRVGARRRRDDRGDGGRRQGSRGDESAHAHVCSSTPAELAVGFGRRLPGRVWRLHPEGRRTTTRGTGGSPVPVLGVRVARGRTGLGVAA